MQVEESQQIDPGEIMVRSVDLKKEKLPQDLLEAAPLSLPEAIALWGEKLSTPEHWLKVSITPTFGR